MLSGMFECLEVEPDGLAAAELNHQLFAIEAVQQRVEVARVAAVAAWDGQRAWARDGATSASAWLRHRLGIPKSVATALVRTARRLRSMPLAAAAFRAGELSYDKVR